MKLYGNKKTGKLIPAKDLNGMESVVDQMGYTDFTGKGQYKTQVYYVLRILEREKYHFFKTTSDGKLNAYLKLGWELIKNKDTNIVSPEFLEEVELNV